MLASKVLRHPFFSVTVFAAMVAGAGTLATRIPSEYAPREDRGAFFVLVNAPEDATFAYVEE